MAVGDHVGATWGAQKVSEHHIISHFMFMKFEQNYKMHMMSVSKLCEHPSHTFASI